MSGTGTLLIVHPDPAALERLSDYLAANAFRVQRIDHPRGAERLMERTPVDLMLVALSSDGLALCRRLAGARNPAFVMMGRADEEVDGILALELGADDVVTDAMSLRYILARLRAVMRRRAAGAEPAGGSGRFLFDGFSYDPLRRRLTDPHGDPVQLTAGEASLLAALLVSPETTVLREGPDPGLGHPAGRGLDLHVSRLRRKLEARGGENMILTHRGVGYRLDRPVRFA